MRETSTEILFDKFEVLECLKKSPESSIYVANHIFLGKKIFLKMVNTSIIKDDTIIKRFKREARILAAIDHSDIIKVYDFGVFEEYFYISFEYFESKNLRQFIKENPLSNDQKIYLFKQIIMGVYEAHRNEIIHRDIKPDNILVNNNLKVKIADFGLAFVCNESTITKSSSLIGTPAYMTSELISGEKANYNTDIFACGILGYELFTNINPLVGDTLAKTIENVLKLNPDKLDYTKVPNGVKDIIKLMIERRKEKRLYSLKEVLDSPIFAREKSFIDLNKTIDHTKQKIRIAYLASIIIFAAIVLSYYFLVYSPARSKFVITQQAKTNFMGDTTKITVLPELLPNSGISKGTLILISNEKANYFVNKVRITDSLINNSIQLEEGKYQISAINKENKIIKKSVNIVKDETRTLNFNFPKGEGTLIINAYPWGEVVIDGKSYGQTPLRESIRLREGKYNIRITNPSFGVINKSVIIQNNRTSKLNVDFEKSRTND